MIRTALKFGGFVLVCLAMTLWLAFTIGNIKLFEENYDLTATFEDANGLLVNDNVKVAGVVVGKVTGIKVEDGLARVSFRVDKDVRVPADSEAAIRWRNLLGQRYIYLYPGDGGTVLADGDQVEKTVSVVDLGQLFNRLGPIIAAIDPQEVNTFLDAIVEGLDGNENKVRQVIDDLGELTSVLGERDEQIGRLIDNLNTVTGTLNARDEQIRVMLDNLVQISATFSENTDVLEAATVELGDFSANLGGVLEGNRAEIDRIIANLATLVEVVESKLGTLDHALSGIDDAAARVYRSSRHGEWLNQVIPCSGNGPPENPDEPCADDGSGVPGGSESVSGVKALEEMMGGGRR